MRLARVLLARCLAWREALTIVQPATLLRWHHQAFRLLRRWRSQPGRLRLPAELQRLIAAMVRDNPTWGEERIAAELLVTLGLRVSPRTGRRSRAYGRGGGGRGATQASRCKRKMRRPMSVRMTPPTISIRLSNLAPRRVPTRSLTRDSPPVTTPMTTLG